MAQKGGGVIMGKSLGTECCSGVQMWENVGTRGVNPCIVVKFWGSACCNHVFTCRHV